MGSAEFRIILVQGVLMDSGPTCSDLLMGSLFWKTIHGIIVESTSFGFSQCPGQITAPPLLSWVAWGNPPTLLSIKV